MGKTLIGKRTRVQIGGTPSKDDDSDTIIGQDNSVYVSEEEARKYDTIIGEKSSLHMSGVDESIQKIIQIMEKSTEPQKDRIIELSREILHDSSRDSKTEKIKELITIASGISGTVMNFAETPYNLMELMQSETVVYEGAD